MITKELCTSSAVYLRSENGTVQDKHVEMIESGCDGRSLSIAGMNPVSSVIVVPLKEKCADSSKTTKSALKEMRSTGQQIMQTLFNVH